MKSYLKSVWGTVGTAPFLLKGLNFVLAYHRVLPEGQLKEEDLQLVVTAEAFREQMEWLSEAFEICPLLDALEDSSTTSKPRVAITFDDGWRDTFEVAAPIMRDNGVVATVFLASGLVGAEKRFWWQDVRSTVRELGISETIQQFRRVAEGSQLSQLRERLDSVSGIETEQDLIETLKSVNGPEVRAALELITEALTEPVARQTMTWAEAREMEVDGHTMAPHSIRHDILTELSEHDARNEVYGSFRDIADNGLAPLNVFAFPNGTSDERTRKIVARAGMKYAFGMSRGSFRNATSCAFDIPRVNVGMHNAPSLKRFKYLMAQAARRVR